MVKEDENFLRASLLLLKGGTLVSKETLKIEVNKSGKIIDDLLKPFEKKLFHKTVKRQREKLFPQGGTGTNIEVWDIAMLVTVLLTVFKDSLDGDQKDHLKTIKTIRDEVYAHSSSSSLSNDDYDDIRQSLEQAYLSLSSSIGNDKKDECYDIIQKCTADPINPEELKKQLENQEDLFQVVINKLNDHKKSLLEMRDEIMAKLDSILKKEDRSTKTITVVDTKLTLSGAINEKADIDFAEDILTKVLNEAIRRAGGDKDYTKIRQVVDKMLADIGNLPDAEVQYAEHKCIILKFKCCSYLGLQTILEYLHSDTFKNILKELAISLNAIERMKSKHINIDAEVTLECLKVILDTLSCSETTNEMGASKVKPLSTALKDLEGLDPKEFEKYRKALNNGDISELKRKIDEDKDKWKNVPVNIAITGNTGVGKSSFINSFRGLKANSEGAAAVGLDETTDEPKKYMHPLNKNIALWDLPGVGGTQKYVKDKYLQNVNFDTYDYFIIIIATRFTENDIWLAKEVERLEKKVIFIRTKMAVDVTSDKHENPQISKDETVTKVRRAMARQVANAGFEGSRLFLIDNHFPLDYDFPHLSETMIDAAPIWKQEAMTLTMTNLTKSIIFRKKAALQKRILKVAIGSAIGGALPLPGVGLFVDVAIVKGEIPFYRKQLGLDDDSLRENAHSLDTTVEKLKAELNLHSHLFGASAKTIVAFVSKLALSEVAEEISSIVIPVFGSVIGATISYSTTVAVLRSILDAFVSDALAVNKRLMHQLSAQCLSEREGEETIVK